MKDVKNKLGQIWVETVIYTLIGIAIIGIVLAIAQPKIEAKKDEVIIEQAIESLGNIDEKIGEGACYFKGNCFSGERSENFGCVCE